MMPGMGLDREVIYFNHAAVSPWPQETTAAVKRFAEENARSGSLHYPRWLETERQLRELLARLINAPDPASIALLKSTSEGLSVVAQGLPWQAGDNIVTFADEFPSNRIPWQALEPRGVEIRYVDPLLGGSPEQALIERCDEKTRLITVSSVQYNHGLRCDLATLGDHCRASGILFCVDAIQSLGAIPFDAQAVQADFVMADGHKWMMGPEGIALFYCRPELLETIELRQFGWHMVANRGDYTAKSWRPAADASRFECGSPNMLGIHALHASLSHLETIGMDKIWARIRENTQSLIDHIHQQHRLRLLTRLEPERRSGIVTFTLSSEDENHALYRTLQAAGVFCALRGGGIRFSPHYYNDNNEISKVFDLISRFMAG